MYFNVVKIHLLNKVYLNDYDQLPYYILCYVDDLKSLYNPKTNVLFDIIIENENKTIISFINQSFQSTKNIFRKDNFNVSNICISFYTKQEYIMTLDYFLKNDDIGNLIATVKLRNNINFTVTINENIKIEYKYKKENEIFYNNEELNNEELNKRKKELIKKN